MEMVGKDASRDHTTPQFRRERKWKIEKSTVQLVMSKAELIEDGTEKRDAMK